MSEITHIPFIFINTTTSQNFIVSIFPWFQSSQRTNNRFYTQFISKINESQYHLIDEILKPTQRILYQTKCSKLLKNSNLQKKNCYTQVHAQNRLYSLLTPHNQKTLLQCHEAFPATKTYSRKILTRKSIEHA